MRVDRHTNESQLLPLGVQAQALVNTDDNAC